MKLCIDKILATADLPSLPEVAHRVLKLVEDSSSSVDDLAAIVRIDPAISAKVLKTANSVFFGRQYKVTSVRAAIPILGSTLIRTLVLGFSLTHQGMLPHLKRVYRKIWRRAIAQAVIAESLAKRVPGEDHDAYFVAGLIQDIGVLAILRANSQEYIDHVFNKASTANQQRLEIERYGFSHVDVSVEFCKDWGLEPQTILAIREHHAPLNLRRNSNATRLDQALKLSATLADGLESDGWQPSTSSKLAISRFFDVNSNQMQDFADEIQTRFEAATNILSVDPANLPSVTELLGNAKIAIEEIAIQSQFAAAAAKTEAIVARNELESAEDWNRKLENDIYKDPLTGVFNRRLLDTGLGPAIDRCSAIRKPLAVLFLDVDNFKSLNDVCGHEFGDQALKTLVEVVQSCVRDEDTVIRYGGDEFLILFAGVKAEELEMIASRICQQARRAFEKLAQSVKVSISAGGVICPVDTLPNIAISSLIPAADAKMYRAKNSGGDGFVIDTLTNIPPED